MRTLVKNKKTCLQISLFILPAVLLLRFAAPIGSQVVTTKLGNFRPLRALSLLLQHHIDNTETSKGHSMGNGLRHWKRTHTCAFMHGFISNIFAEVPIVQAGTREGGNTRRAAASIDLERRLSGNRRLSISHSDLEPVYHSKQDIDSRRAAARVVSVYHSSSTSTA